MSSSPSTSWNLSIEDTSPILSYSPYEGLELSNGWSQHFSENGFMKDGNKPKDQGKGDSAHVTSLNGASVSFSFWGQGIDLYGMANSSYQIDLDNVTQQASPQNDLLYSNTGLSEGQHSVKLTALPNAGTTEQLWFDRADIHLSNGAEPPKSTLVNNTNQLIHYSGAWETVTDSANPSPYHITEELNAAMSFQFNGSRAIALQGRINDDHGMYSVALDNGDPEFFNGSSFWLIEDALLYLKIVSDPGPHTVKLSIPQKAWFAFDSVNLYDGNMVDSTETSNGPQQSGPVPTVAAAAQKRVSGASIAGAVIGSLLGVTLLALGVWYFFRRRKLRSDPEKSLAHPSVTPFQSRFVQLPSPRHATPESLPPATTTTQPDLETILQFVSERIDRRNSPGDDGTEEEPPRYHFEQMDGRTNEVQDIKVAPPQE